MWKPKWACTTCGMLSSRRYSVKRHIIKLHGGNGLEVPYVDYMAGMLIGIYKPNLSKQKSSSKYSIYSDNLYNPNTLSYLFSSYANPFMQYGRPEAAVYPSVNGSTLYFDQSYKAMKPPLSAQPPSLASQMATEYCLEYVRGLARKALDATILQPNSQSSPIQGGLGSNPTTGVQDKQDIFGYRFVICKDCLLTHPLQVSFGKDGTKNNNNDNNNDNNEPGLVTRIEQKHECDPKLVASNTKEVLDKEGSIKSMIDELPRNSIKVTKRWIENQNNRCSLIAVKIPHKNNNDDDNIEYNADNDDNTIQPEQENIEIPNPKNPKQKMTFHYSKEKHINLSLTPNEIRNNHWAARAIKDGHTILTNDEMEDFLKMVQHTSTFAIFTIHMPSTTITASSSTPPSLQKQQHHNQQQNESLGLYFLAIRPYDDTMLPNESNKNNNNNNKSVQSNSTNDTYTSLHNHLINISSFTIPTVNSQSSSN